LPAGDLAGALGELRDGAGDAPREVETEPREREHDDQGHEEEEQDVDALDRVLEQLELLVLANACEIPRTLASSRSVTCVPTTTAPITCRSPPASSRSG